MRQKILVHPDNYDWLISQFQPLEVVAPHVLSELFGIPVYKDKTVAKTTFVSTGQYIFPWDRFIEYEQSDAGWAYPLGLAKKEMVEVNVYYIVTEDSKCEWLPPFSPVVRYGDMFHNRPFTEDEIGSFKGTSL